jgi:hypothetical protein
MSPRSGSDAKSHTRRGARTSRIFPASCPGAETL